MEASEIKMEDLEVDWKSNETFGIQMEVVGSGLEVDGNFHALPCLGD